MGKFNSPLFLILELIMPTGLTAIIILLTASSAHARRVGSPSSTAVFEDHGIFILEIGGRRIGSESFQIRARGSQIEALAEIQIHGVENGQPSAFKTSPDLVLNAALDPISYTWVQKRPQYSRISIDFMKSPARVRYHTISGAQDNRAFALPRDVIVLDDNVIDQYELLAMRYLRTPGGKQNFQAFIPQEALPGTVSVASAGTENIDLDGRNQPTQHLVLNTGLARIDLWVDQQGRLLRMERASVRFIALRAR